MTRNDRWSTEELNACVDSYLEMLLREIDGQSFNKSEYNRNLRKNTLMKRTQASVELRMQNISAVLCGYSLPWIKGYKPRKNVGSNVWEVIVRRLIEHSIFSEIDMSHTIAEITSSDTKIGKPTYWWDNRESESYWLEITDREDLGANLHAPQTNRSGGEYWSYSFVAFTKPKDIVFHFQKGKGAIVAYSVISEEPVFEEDLKWAARGTYSKGTIPYRRKGWLRNFSEHYVLDRPLSVEMMRPRLNEIIEKTNALLFPKPKKNGLYFPFELKSSRPMRPMQGYLFKFPSCMIEIFPDLIKGKRHPVPKRKLNIDPNEANISVRLL